MEEYAARHRRIPMSQIEESPKNGCYITKKDMERFRLFSTIFFGLTGLLLLLPRKK